MDPSNAKREMDSRQQNTDLQLSFYVNVEFCVLPLILLLCIVLTNLIFCITGCFKLTLTKNIYSKIGLNDMMIYYLDITDQPDLLILYLQNAFTG